MAAEPAFWFVFCCPGDGCAAWGDIDQTIFASRFQTLTTPRDV
jgi:hypothetical protein